MFPNRYIKLLSMLLIVAGMQSVLAENDDDMDLGLEGMMEDISIPGVEINSDGISIGDGAVSVGSDGINVVDMVSVGENGKVNVNGGTASVVVEDGWIKIDSPDTSVNVDGWRVDVETDYQATDTAVLLEELDAVDEGDNIKVVLAGDVLFDFDKADVRADAVQTLVKLAYVLRQKAEDVTVIGHTDSVGKDDYNKKLSDRRAISVIAWLNQNQKIPAQLMKAKGVGATQPVAHNINPDGSDNPAGRAKNRRVEITFTELNN